MIKNNYTQGVEVKQLLSMVIHGVSSIEQLPKHKENVGLRP